MEPSPETEPTRGTVEPQTLIVAIHELLGPFMWAHDVICELDDSGGRYRLLCHPQAAGGQTSALDVTDVFEERWSAEEWTDYILAACELLVATAYHPDPDSLRFIRIDHDDTDDDNAPDLEQRQEDN